MDFLLQLLLFVLIGLLLLWFGFSVLLRLGKTGGGGSGGPARGSSGRRPSGDRLYKQAVDAPTEGSAGSVRTCPICAARFEHGERVKSTAFPESGLGQGRLMHIEGCAYCLGGPRSGKRKCPVCGAQINTDEILFARMFDKPGRSHVHVLGCSRCRGPGSKS
jgi:endogenous inhibitor of DNA gyrase (YacG/DUF329 family)